MRRIGLIVGLLLLVGTMVGAVVTARSSGSDEKHESTTVSSVAVASDGPAPVDDDRDSSTIETTGNLPVRLVEVTDGDTIDVAVEGRSDTVRLVGINAPEDGECLGGAATARLAELLDGAGTITLTADDPGRDGYGRMLTDVLIDGRSAGEVLVAEGLALSVSYGRSKAEQESLDEAQSAARLTEVGLWAPSPCGGSGPAGLRITHIESDAPGDDGRNLNGEWIEIAATDDADLTGWGIRDESSSHRYAFPDGFTLTAGEVVRVRSGCGTPSGGELFWCTTGSAIWNNSGDTGFLVDPSGSFADVWSY